MQPIDEALLTQVTPEPDAAPALPAAALAGEGPAREARRYRRLLEQLSDATIDGILIVDPEGTIVWSNRRLAEMWKLPAEVIASRSDAEALTSIRERLADPDEFFQKVRFLYEHPDVASRDEIALSDGRIFDRWSAPLREEDGSSIGRAWFFRDVTDAKRIARTLAEATRRSTFLSDAGALLAAAVDAGEICRGLARLSVPILGDWCLVDLLDERGRIRRAAVSHSGRAGDSLVRAITGPPPWIPDAIRFAMDSERSRISTEVPALRTDAGDKLVPASLLAVPLSARGRTLGAITFLSEHHPYSESDVSLARDLAARAAPAIDNAHLYRERSNIARILQESLLPTRLPAVPGMQIAARYRAAGEAMDAGGDFYDVFGSGPNSWFMVVGDVCGKGARAAALTALARYTLRAAGLKARKPRAILESLNEALWHEDVGERFCTLAAVRLEPRDDGVRATLCIAGHPFPYLMRADGSVETIGVPGTALGITEQPRLTETSMTLRRGDSLVIVTDGFTEARGPYGPLGEEGVATLISECAGLGVEETAQQLEDRTLSFQRDAPRDDMALVVASVTR